RLAVPLGVNIGKNRDTPNERAAEDYRACLRVLFPYADYFVINVSSPNTPGLRELQRGDALRQLLGALRTENGALAAQWGLGARPLLVKIAPDLGMEELEAILAAALEAGVAGVIATNTTVRREGVRGAAGQAGGLSGRPLRERSTRVIAAVYRLTGGRLPIIGVGGIFSGDDAYEKIRAGASLVQVYTGLIYEGPSLPARINRRLLALLERDGFDRLAAAVGRDAQRWPDPTP
ncbi:MAG TPA: quinone-dependent dihydroorotate dehydrogenase, partial [Bacillota bacterium]